MRATGSGSEAPRRGWVEDARGTRVRLLDPVRMHVLRRPAGMPQEVVDRIAEEVLPALRTHKWVQ